ncbi:ecto-ADP-ribosyltransferase 5-like isoform X2 [Bufo bufo]|nr:ecto-ADP-ribosyltransferase 5-like isoform X2 [Bufo bufo]XP_040282579.1 ecto-ADP-ribosyltransferase 5-like isoform X2 [Bufo bufo]XP_040282580.1 ecto-ADP-ribosyltransferase 5-like isoform X2 [Bufo bufo]XP_040282581.1 ecto-ADP-ribosyltransferase 5-like isoform X2 [Bufo bufo]XP_040282582.1 ecto-ADP-ribosyltransferase 5-like isoform X2 [Bufo bufo]
MLCLTGAIFWLLAAFQCLQVYGEIHKMTSNPNVFDDQYIGCYDELEKNIMPKVLHKEKENKQFKEAWGNAAEWWYYIKDNLELPEGFQDEYGVALLTFTKNYPEGNPIGQQMNGNLTVAGASQKDYMEKFHFKALHFYLTRALQMLKPNCEESYVTYRGSQHSIHIQPVSRFDSFTSSSLNPEEAQMFGSKSLFQITTCFGAKLGKLSFVPLDEEVLIPPTEKFVFVTEHNSFYMLKSTGQMCSYFNCAYLEAEKRKDPICRSATTEPMGGTKYGDQLNVMSAAEIEERMKVFEEKINQNQLFWKHHHAELGAIFEQFTDSGNKTNMYRSLRKLGEHIKALKDQTESISSELKSVVQNEGEIIKFLVLHDEAFAILKKELNEHQEVIQGIAIWLGLFTIGGATIFIYKYFMRNPGAP